MGQTTSINPLSCPTSNFNFDYTWSSNQERSSVFYPTHKILHLIKSQNQYLIIMSLLEYELSSSSSMATFNPDLLHLHSLSESYSDQSLFSNNNTDSEMQELQSVSLFTTIWNLFKTSTTVSQSKSILSSASSHHSDVVLLSDQQHSPATGREREDLSHQEPSYTVLCRPHESVLKPVEATPITPSEDSHKLSTPVGSPSRSISLPRIDLTTVRSNDTLVHTFPASLRATSGGGHHFGHGPYPHTQSVGGIPGNQLNSHSKTTCAICMDSINDQYDLIKLPCNHLFHAERCIIPWIERNASCPVCRHRLMAVDPLFRGNNLSLPDHLYHAYHEGIFRGTHHLSRQLNSNHSTYPRHNSNDPAVVTATIWDSYSRFMMQNLE